MNKAYVILIPICALIFIGVVSNFKNQKTTRTKAVVIKEPPYLLRYRRYGYVIPPPRYNLYKTQYY